MYSPDLAETGWLKQNDKKKNFGLKGSIGKWNFQSKPFSLSLPSLAGTCVDNIN